jgi:hypothetical protein
MQSLKTLEVGRGKQLVLAECVSVGRGKQVVLAE